LPAADPAPIGLFMFGLASAVSAVSFPSFFPASDRLST